MISLAGRFPVAIGGIGGSGTRVGAALLKALGYYIGDDLNESLDNLWFTLLFKRRDVLLEPPERIEDLVALLWSRMSGGAGLSANQEAMVAALADEHRAQHDKAWLQDRVATFLATDDDNGVDRPWGWKEPNTHVIIEWLLELKPTLRYIHFSRHPLDMALSSNQNQLELWGPITLQHPIERTPRWSLKYWCSTHRRMERLKQRYPERIFLMDFDGLCAAPNTAAIGMADFLGIDDAGAVSAALLGLVDPQLSGGHKFTGVDRTKFDPSDIAYIQDIGYQIAELS